MIAAVAAARRSFGHLGELPHTCRICRRRDAKDYREEWGCDSATPEPQFMIPCIHCKEGDPDCPVCGGTGEEEYFRCPLALSESWTDDFLLLHTAWPGTLLSAGGIADQPALYVEAMFVLDLARGRMEHEREEELRRKHEQEQAAIAARRGR